MNEAVALQNPDQDSPRRDVATEAELHTIGYGEVVLTDKQLPWTDGGTVSMVTVESSDKTLKFQFGNVIGLSPRAEKIATKDMVGRESDEDRLNRTMYDSIRTILQGNPESVKRMKNAPEGTTIFYAGLSNGARVFFADLGCPAEGMPRTFVKIGVCGSKRSEPALMTTFSGKKERVK